MSNSVVVCTWEPGRAGVPAGAEDERRAALEALGSAVTGAQSTSHSRQSIDPGAASATNILGGIFGSFLPGVVNAEGRARQGANTAKLDARNLAGGVYFVKLRSADESRTAKVIIN